MCNIARLLSLSLKGRVCMFCATRSSLDQGRRTKRSEREVGCVGLREERGLRDLVPIIFAALARWSHCFTLSALYNPSMYADMSHHSVLLA